MSNDKTTKGEPGKEANQDKANGAEVPSSQLADSLDPKIKELIGHLHFHSHLTEDETDKLLRVYVALNATNTELATAWIVETLAVSKHHRESEIKLLGLAEKELGNDRLRIIYPTIFSAFVILLIVGLIGILAYLQQPNLATAVIVIATGAIGLSKIIGVNKKPSSQVVPTPGREVGKKTKRKR